MTFRQWLIILLCLVAISLAFAVSLSRAFGAECTDYNEIMDYLLGKGAHLDIIPTDKLQAEADRAKLLTGITYEGVTRAFELYGPGGRVIGLEIGGCLLDPIRVWKAQDAGA